MIHFRDAREVMEILRDMVTYMSIQNKNDDLGSIIVRRAMRILEDNENLNKGDSNDIWYWITRINNSVFYINNGSIF